MMQATQAAGLRVMYQNAGRRSLTQLIRRYVIESRKKSMRSAGNLPPHKVGGLVHELGAAFDAISDTVALSPS